MQLRVITKDGITPLKNLKVGTNVLCDDGKSYPVKSILLIVHTGYFVKISTSFFFYVSPRTKIKTKNGIKFLELYDTLFIDANLTPSVIQINPSTTIKFYYDILIDGNMISPEGIVFNFSD